MDEALDKRLNRKINFKYPTIDAKRYVRLLRLSPEEHQAFKYSLEVIPLADLPRTHYRALSYTWGNAPLANDIQEVHINGQAIIIRRNLFDFLNTATA